MKKKMPEYVAATLAERIDFTPELAVFRVMPSYRLDFSPGQFANLGIEEAGRVIQRPYSIASASSEPLLEFFLELVPGGALTPRLWELTPGDRLMIRNQAAGTFHLDSRIGFTRHMMMATVTGVAPFISMLRTNSLMLTRHQDIELRFLLLHAASHPREFGFYNDELKDLARQGWLTYVDTVSRPLENPDWAGETGRAEDIIRKYGDALGYDYASTVAYACGHPVMVENAKAILGRARFPKRQIHTEKYFSIK
jgi:ferredoxin--NADP+ reductase